MEIAAEILADPSPKRLNINIVRKFIVLLWFLFICNSLLLDFIHFLSCCFHLLGFMIPY